MKPHLLDMTAEELRRAVEAAGEKPYRADQLANWVYAKGVTDAGKMSNLPARLVARFDILTSRVAAKTESDDGCVKLLVEMSDGCHVEAVLIPSARRATACVSTQAGCAMGCAFCASGLGGLDRNLTCSEILEQLLHLREATGHRVTHVVFMGMGEPLANYNATVAAVRAIVDPERFGISARRVTISTVGLPRQIRRLAREDLPVTLAISLHAPNDIVRRQLIPASSPHSIAEVLEAAEEFYRARNREITLEYVLLAGVNDSPVCADALAKVAGRLRCNVNLFRYNPVADLPFTRPSQSATKAFADRLQRHGVNVNVRRSRGLDADAACGQLRRRTAEDLQPDTPQADQPPST